MGATSRAALPWEEEATRPWDEPSAADARGTESDTPSTRPAVGRRPDPRADAPRMSAGLVRLLLLVALGLTLLLTMTTAIDWARTRWDDLRYGRPRTTHISGFVGHHDGDGVPTHLMAVNLNRRIVIIEFPGGDPSRVRTLAGPYLVGRDEDLTVATMRLLDVSGDGHPDLLLRVKNEELVYINDNGEFRLMTRAERPVVERALGGAK